MGRKGQNEGGPNGPEKTVSHRDLNVRKASFISQSSTFNVQDIKIMPCMLCTKIGLGFRSMK